MNKQRWMILMNVALLGLAMAVVPGGCETDEVPDTEGVDEYFASHPYISDPREEGSPRDVTVSPSSIITTNIGEVFVLTADGGEPPYDWDVTDNSAGSIDSPSRDGITATYVTKAVAGNSIIVSDDRGHAAICSVNGNISPAEDLTVTADPEELTEDGDRAVVTVSGGDPGYHWSVANTGLGTIDRNTGESVVYTRKKFGDNAVTVRDSAGRVGSVVIAQPEFVNELVATANPDTLDSNGSKSILTATGGRPPYSWSVEIPAKGTVSPSQGSSVVYTRLDDGDNAVYCTDDAGTVVTLVIAQPP